MIPTPTEIQYFLEIYQTQHISNAAIRLAITQPTLTQSLQKLEEKLGVALFHRTRQGAVPTAAGKSFYQKARTLLENWKEVSDGVLSAKTELQGKFRVGCHSSVGSYTIPALLEGLEKKAPLIEISLTHDFSRKITEKIISFELDLAFVINPVKHPDLVLKKLGEDTVTFWKKKGATKIPKRIFADLNLTQVQSLLSKSQRSQFDGWQLIESTSLELIRTMTLSGQGIGIIPTRIANADHQDLQIYDSNLPVFKDEIYLAYRKESLNSVAGKALIEQASGVLR